MLRGDRIVNTNYDVRVGVDQECTILCTQSITAEEREAFVKKINEAYTVHLLADNLPIATKWKLEGKIMLDFVFLIYFRRYHPIRTWIQARYY